MVIAEVNQQKTCSLFTRVIHGLFYHLVQAMERPHDAGIKRLKGSMLPKAVVTSCFSAVTGIAGVREACLFIQFAGVRSACKALQ